MAKKALAVGVSNYGFPNDLPNCTRDAEAFGSMLETIYRFEDVRVLKDGEATRDEVDRALESLFQNATSNDRLVLFFSGHGCRFEKGGVIEEALVLPDGRLLTGRHLVDRMASLPAGVFTAVLDCCFSGLDELLLQPTGEIEVARAKRWLPVETDRGRPERLITHGAQAFTPFGHVKPATVEAMAMHVRGSTVSDPTSARLISLAEPQAAGVFVLPSLADETTVAGTSETGGLSPFTYCLLNEIRRRGPNRSAFELLQATGHGLRRLGLRQTPLVKEPPHPEHLALRAFMTFQPVLFVYPSPGPGAEAEASVAEAVRAALFNIQEGRSMHATMPGTQTQYGEELGTILNTVTPIVASVLQARAWQPYGGYQQYGAGSSLPQGFGTPGIQGWQGQPGGFGGWFGAFGQRGQFDEIAQIVSAVVPAVLMGLQTRQQQQPFAPGFQFHPPLGGGLQPYDVAQIVNTVTPIVTSLIQGRGYQGQFGQFMPRAA